jgi:hypothetical protein
VSIFEQYFNYIYIEDTDIKTLSKKDSIILTQNTYFKDNTLIVHDWYDEWYQQGYKVLEAEFHERYVDEQTLINNNRLNICNQNWFWYAESLWYHHLGHTEYVRKSNVQKCFFMPIRLRRKHRDQIIKKFQPLLSESLYSYNGMGIYLPEDLDYQHPDYQRYLNSKWYDNTCFSVVVETKISNRLFISEKIFKPLAYYHPLIVWGSPGSLKHLQEIGFETFGHTIDESYDTITSPSNRLNAIFTIVNDLTQKFIQGKDIFEDKITKQKVQHNHDRFFNKSLVEGKIKTEIIDTILEFVES